MAFATSHARGCAVHPINSSREENGPQKRAKRFDRDSSLDLICQLLAYGLIPNHDGMSGQKSKGHTAWASTATCTRWTRTPRSAPAPSRSTAGGRLHGAGQPVVGRQDRTGLGNRQLLRQRSGGQPDDRALPVRAGVRGTEITLTMFIANLESGSDTSDMDYIFRADVVEAETCEGAALALTTICTRWTKNRRFAPRVSPPNHFTRTERTGC